MQSLIFKDCKARKSLRYIDNLEGIVDTYMKRYHRGIKMSSLSAQDPANALKLRDQFERQYLDLKKEPVKFTIGNFVRITTAGKAFKRIYQPQSTEEVFVVEDVCTKHKIPKNTLCDLEGTETIDGGFSYGRENTTFNLIFL